MALFVTIQEIGMLMYVCI